MIRTCDRGQEVLFVSFLRSPPKPPKKTAKMDLPYDDDVLQILSSIECDHVESFRRVPTELKNDETFVLRAVARNYQCAIIDTRVLLHALRITER